MTDAAAVQFEVPDSIPPATGAGHGPGFPSAGANRKGGLRHRVRLSLDEVRHVLRQEPVIFAPLMDGASPFGADLPVTPNWKQDGDTLALHLMRHLNALKDDENGVTLVIGCAGAYLQGLMDHLMIWNVSLAGDTPKLQVGNHESIGGRHYPTDKIDTVALWQALDPTGGKNSNAAGTAIDTFAKTPVGLSVAQHGLFINVFPAVASENFEPALAMLAAREAGQRFGVLDGQKSCFTTARDLLGATKTKGPRGETVDWGEGRPEPVMPVIRNRLSLLTNNERPVGIETAQGKQYDLTDPAVREAMTTDRAAFMALCAKLGGWINRKPGAYQLTIRPALQAH